MPPLVSVLMPIYNCEDYVAQAIESILDQTFKDYELIIIDDGSTDNTVNIADAYNDERIRFVKNKNNKGIISRLNEGIELAVGEYIARMDGDDISHPQRFQKQVDFLNQHSEIGIVGCGFVLINETGKHSSSQFLLPENPRLIQWSLYYYSPIAHPSVMMRSEILHSLNGYSKKYLHAEDYDLWVRASRITSISNMNECLLYLRKHEGNITNQNHIHMRNVKKISQSLVSLALGRQVSQQDIESMREYKCHSLRDAQKVMSIILELYSEFILRKNVTHDERSQIRSDAAFRCYRLFRPYIRRISAWRYLLKCIVMDARIIFKMLRVSSRKRKGIIRCT